MQFIFLIHSEVHHEAFKPAWQSDNEERAIKAVHKIIDQATLYEIFKTAPLNSTKFMAIQQMTDQVALADIAIESESTWITWDSKSNNSIGSHAVECLKDKNELERVVKNAECSIVKKEAKKKLLKLIRNEASKSNNYSALIIELAKHDEDSDVLWETISLLPRQVLVEIKQNNDKTVLIQMVENELHYRICNGNHNWELIKEDYYRNSEDRDVYTRHYKCLRCGELKYE